MKHGISSTSSPCVLGLFSLKLGVGQGEGQENQRSSYKTIHTPGCEAFLEFPWLGITLSFAGGILSS